MTAVTILDEAEDELLEAIEYYEGKSPGLGLDFAKEVKASVELIRHFPEACALREDGTRRCLTRRFPYIIVYLSHEGRVWVVAIAHCKRRPGYWADRIGGPGSGSPDLA